MSRDQAKTISSSLYPQDIEIIQKYAKTIGVSFSDAHRRILRQWETMKSAGVYVSELPRPSDGQVVPVVFVEKREG